MKSQSQYFIVDGAYPDLFGDRSTRIAFWTVLNLEVYACVVWMHVFGGFDCDKRCVYIYNYITIYIYIQWLTTH